MGTLVTLEDVIKVVNLQQQALGVAVDPQVQWIVPLQRSSSVDAMVTTTVVLLNCCVPT
jgi:hypothetical protein